MEKIKLGDIHKTGFFPPIVYCFIDINEKDIYNIENTLRHPGGIFNITSLYITKSLSEFIDKCQDGNNDYDSIFNSFRLVLYDLFKFYDSCFEIMACFCKSATPLTDKGFIDQWIEKNGYTVGKKFKEELNDDIKNLKNIYNKLKHTSNRIAWVSINSEQNTCIGYYLETRSNTGTAAPANDIDFPISLNREIRKIYYLIYKIAEVLKDVLSIHIAEHNTNIKFRISSGSLNDEVWIELFNKIEILPQMYLYNEIGEEVFKPIIENEELIMTKENIDKTEWDKNFIPPIKITHTTGGDGYTKSFTFPHMGLAKDISQISDTMNARIS